MVQETAERQEQGSQALARTGPSAGRDSVRTQTVDLDDVPVYASTGTRRIPMGRSGQHWIEIQEELDFGQQTILDNASVIGIQRGQTTEGEEASQTVRLDLTRQRFLLCATWLVRWNLPADKNGKEIKLPRHINDRIETMKRLSPQWGDAIVAAITEHVAQRQELAQAAQDAADAEAGIDTDEEEDREEIPPLGRQSGTNGTEHSSSDGGSSGGD